MKFQLFVVFIGLQLSVLAQNSLNVKAIDKVTSAPIEGIKVLAEFSKQDDLTLFTDENGQAVISWTGKSKFLRISAFDKQKRYYAEVKFIEQGDLDKLKEIVLSLRELPNYAVLFNEFKARDIAIDAQLKSVGGDTVIREITDEKNCSEYLESNYAGGALEMQKFISKHVEYPMHSIENKEQGRVYMSFVVERDGQISHLKVERGVSPSLDYEAARLIYLMPNWDPAKCDNGNVRSRVRLPINFTLN